MLILGVDPGGKHVGASYIHLARTHPSSWEVDDRGAETLDADVAVDHLMDTYGYYEDKTLVVEEFRLYANAAMSQVHSEMETSELIGALKYAARKRGFKIVMQGALIKKPTRRQLPARGIQSVATGVHAKDAELHTIHYALKEGLWPGN